MVEITPNLALTAGSDLLHGNVLGAAKDVLGSTPVGGYLQAAEKLSHGDVLGAVTSGVEAAIPGLSTATNLIGDVIPGLKDIPVIGGLFGGGGPSEADFQKIAFQMMLAMAEDVKGDLDDLDSDYSDFVGDDV